MAYTDEHAYLTFGGSLPGGEEWQTGCRFQKFSVPGGAWDDAFADIGLSDIYDDLVTWFSSSSNLFGVGSTLAWAKLASIGTDGLYTLEPRLHEAVTPTPGSAGSFQLPNQVSTVVSLRSGSTFGTANFGRMYLPPTNWTVSTTTGLTGSSAANGIRDRANEMLTAVQGEMSTVLQPLRLAIFSARGTGTTKPVTKVLVGQAMDTHRTRREGLPETYAEVDFPV